MAATMTDTSFLRAKWARRVVRQKLFEDLQKIRQAQSTPANPNLSFRAEEASPDSLLPILLGDLTGLLANPGDLSPLNLPTDPNMPPPEELNPPQAPPGDDLPDRSHGGFSHRRPADEIVLPEPEHRICIIGAGVTGLYIAMILDSLRIPGLTYDILEASPRAGGRLLTYRFSDDIHDYYDIGAMRFPHIKIMQRTFDLFNLLEVPLIKYYLNSGQGAVKCPTMYNDYTYIDGGEKPKTDPYRVSVKSGGRVPDDKVDKTDDLINDAFGPFKRAMVNNFEEGFQKLMLYDEYSTREFLKNPPKPGPDFDKDPWPTEKLDFFTVQWLETNNTSSGLFDQAFSESVMDSFDFDNPQDAGKPVEWYCIEGGARRITEKMLKKIQRPVQYGKRVKKISQPTPNGELLVEIAGESTPRQPYATVFNTTSLACLQRVDLTGLSLHPCQKDAIRSLHYDDSAKVAIKFASPWWITQCGITSGGVASTDLPIRTCVYPSYNIHDSVTEPAILLCSYTWAQDATRIGSLVDKNRLFKDEEELKDLMIRNLARLHQRNWNEECRAKGQPELDLEAITAKISDLYLEHHAFSWSHDPYTSGAFALFGPGQFSNLYPFLSRPTAGSRFHFCGEASSAHHAWIVGSLDSALASVQRYFRRFKMWKAIDVLKNTWDAVPEVEDQEDGTLFLQVALGMLPPKMMAAL